jgi:hypothetical protein
MVRTGVFAASLALFAGGAYGDVTLRQSVTMKFSNFIPQSVQDTALKNAKGILPAETVQQVKGDRAYVSWGQFAVITADHGQKVTVLDPQTKQYATASLSEYMDAFTSGLKKTPSPEVQQVLRNLHADVQSKKTGQVALIKGIRAEETLITITIQMAAPAAAASTMRMEMHYWIAQPDEIRRVPALGELADYAEQSRRSFDPTQWLQGFAPVPGMADQLSAVQDLLKNNIGLPLKVSIGFYLPALTQALQLAPQAVAGFDPNAPLTELQMDVSDLSTAPISDSVFTVPKSYRTAPIEELVKGLTQKQPQVPDFVLPVF